MVERQISGKIRDRLFKQKAIIIIGARQVGKTTLVKNLFDSNASRLVLLNCDEPDVKLALENVTTTQIKSLIGNNNIVIIDEAQRVNNIGLTIKLIVDNMHDVQVIATGSSAFELRNKMNEPLTGRKYEFHLYPFSTSELAGHSSDLEERRVLEDRLVFGMYPDVVNNVTDRARVLRELTSSYLFKDVFSVKDIRNHEGLEKLLTLLALQLGSEVSYNELARTLGIDKETVERYLDLLEKVFVVFRLSSFNRNLRSELKKTKKVYFYDNGIRNAIINNFQPIALRTDKGPLWENFLISERIKRNEYSEQFSNNYFWRTHSQQEIDFLEEHDGKLFAFEFKWSKKKSVKPPISFSNNYPDHTFSVITPENYIEFLKI